MRRIGGWCGVLSVVFVVLVSGALQRNLAGAIAATAQVLQLPIEVKNSEDLILAHTVVEPGGEARLQFPLNTQTQFVYLYVNSSAVSGGLNVSGHQVLPFVRESYSSFVFTRSSNSIRDSVIQACNAAKKEDHIDHSECLFTLSIGSGGETAPVAVEVSGLRGTMINLGERYTGSISQPDARITFGLELSQMNLPALITLMPNGMESAMADFDIEVYTFEKLSTGGNGPEFYKKFPKTGQFNIRGVSPERILVHSLQTNFLRLDVISRNSKYPQSFLLQVDANYTAVDIYTISLVGTIGVACLLALCLIGSVCCLLAKHSAQRNSSQLQGVELLGSSTGLDADYVKKLPCAKFKSLQIDSEDATCVICIEDYELDDMIRTLPCHHHFHDVCISKWLQGSKQCPLCQRVFGDGSDTNSAEQA